ncbi:protein of unknown function (DUF929) [Metallosphaera yellowstonensis MK1]|uniref:DUF929 domain-containing protein n=2 Tax=Metallosphaera TaxID=41980 RepID=H2C7Q3_9CREN|nr:protein of unknown function (DUF929) [Metallosphaera yellowstonensis MK1]
MKNVYMLMKVVNNMARSKRGKQQKESKMIYIPFVALLLVIVLFIGLSFHQTASASTDAFTHFVKVSSNDYAPPGKVDVYFVSWYGCPYGATLSWPLYLALDHYGQVQVIPHYSLSEEELGGAVPGLLFQGFEPNSSVDFHFLYIYNQYLNATPDGKPLNGEAVQIGLQEIQNDLPPWVSQYVEQYQLNLTRVPAPNGTVTPIAYASPIPHIVTTLIITGPGGTWLMLGYPSNLEPQQIIDTNSTTLLSQIQSGNVPAPIQSAASTIESIISQAEGS